MRLALLNFAAGVEPRHVKRGEPANPQRKSGTSPYRELMPPLLRYANAKARLLDWVIAVTFGTFCKFFDRRGRFGI